jgi:probable F420-dependent oxidoreductase
MTTQRYVRAAFAVPPRFWEPLVSCAFVAAATKNLRFGTGVLVLPLRRDIVVTAKQIATLDHFSGGRLEIGVGIGAYREEFAALSPQSVAVRGDMLEEGIAALRLLFAERVASFTGKYYRFRDVELYPKPLQPKLPIYIGGNHANHLRRVARAADGWIPAAMAADRLRPQVARLRELAAAAGRDPEVIQVAPQYVVHLGRTQEDAVARFRQSQMFRHLMSLRQSTLREETATAMEEVNLVGSADAVIAKAEALTAAGVTHFLGLYFAADGVAELRDQMQMFAEEVMPRITG